MSDITTEQSPAEGVANWQLGDITLARQNAHHSVATATDWGRLLAPVQSGLPYHWVDSLPIIPKMTAGRLAQLAIKRAIDIGASACFLFFFMPVMLGLALAVAMTSPGPVLFRQKRVGLRGELFDILKFRTMYVDRGDTTGVKQTVDGDARVTPLGRFMRQRSLDELPQLLNVLFGTMSLVGPRPHVAGQLAAGRPCAEVIHYYELRHAMKPGLTGWAQVNGYRGPTDTITKAQARVDHDLAYIQNFTVLLDLKIIWRTFWKEVVTGSGS